MTQTLVKMRPAVESPKATKALHKEQGDCPNASDGKAKKGEMAMVGDLGMTIEQMRSLVVGTEKYLKGLSMWQANGGNQGVHQTQTETRAFWVMMRVPNGCWQM